MSWQETCTGNCYVYRKRMVLHREGAAPGLDFSPFTRMSNYAATFTLIHNSYPLDVRLSCPFPVTLQWLIAVNILYRGMGGLPPVSNWLGFEKTRGPGRESNRPCRSSEEFTQKLYRHVISTIGHVQKFCCCFWRRPSRCVSSIYIIINLLAPELFFF